MRLLEEFPAVPYRDPWAVPLDMRWRNLCRGAVKVAYVYEKPDNSTFRYRAYNMVQALSRGDRRVGAGYFFLNELSTGELHRLGETADIIVLCRTRFQRKLARLAEMMSRRNKPLFFDTDDLVFAPRHIPVLMDTLGEPADVEPSLDLWYSYVGRLRASLELCTNALCTNDFLAGQIREERAISTHIIPNFMNREQIGISARLTSAKKRIRSTRKEKIWLGYFSGTPTHNNDFLTMSSGLARCMAEDARLHLAIVGYLDLPPALEPFAARVKRFPFQDFVNLQRLIAAVDVNLMPLLVNTFTNCKSELKYFEAGIVGVPSAASPSHTYTAAINQNGGGVLAGAHQWADALRELTEDPVRTRKAGELARRDALKRYTPQAVADRLVHLFCSITR